MDLCRRRSINTNNTLQSVSSVNKNTTKGARITETIDRKSKSVHTDVVLLDFKSFEWVGSNHGNGADGQVVFYFLRVGGASAEYPEMLRVRSGASERASTKDTARKRDSAFSTNSRLR